MTTARLKKQVSHKPVRVSKMQAVHAPQLSSALAEHIHRIGILGKRIDGYIEFMSAMNENPGLSDEIKTRAAIAFYEQLIVVEQQLRRIHDAYQLE